MRSLLAPALLFLLALLPPLPLSPKASTDAVAHDADDPAIWINRSNPSSSRVLGTCKGGGLYVFDLRGRKVQSLSDYRHLNNVDIEYGFRLGSRKADVAVATERADRRLLVFSIDRQSGRLTDISGDTSVFGSELDDLGAPMGVALYRRKDGEVFAFVSRKESPKRGAIWQYRLVSRNDGKVDAVKVREVGSSSGDEIEALAVDDELGFLYCSEEKVGIHKYFADPAHPRASERVALFGTDRFMKDREGIGIYTKPNGKGYIVVSDQGSGPSQIHIYPREGNRHELLAEIPTGADTTDGLEVTSTPLPGYEGGMMANMNSKGRNFLLYGWKDVERLLRR